LLANGLKLRTVDESARESNGDIRSRQFPERRRLER
jgi:hypothetical protein